MRARSVHDDDDDLQAIRSRRRSRSLILAAQLTPGIRRARLWRAGEEEQHGLLRDLASRLTKIALAGTMGAETARNVSAFRVFRTRLREGFKEYRNPSVSIDVLLTWTSLPVLYIAIKVVATRTAHEGHIGLPLRASRSGSATRST